MSSHRFALATCALLACAAWSSARADEFTLSGSIIALRGSGLVLSNGSESLAVGANGTFTFATPLASGTSYNVTVVTRPSSPTQGCLVANGRGTITANVTNVQVACVTSMFKVGGTVMGFDGSGLVLRNNGETLAVSANGAFMFPRGVRSGDAYNVTVETQPEHPIQNCTVTDGSGTIGDSNVTNVAVVCTTPPPLRLLNSTPAPQATDVSRTEPFVLNFAAPLDPQTVDPTRVLLNNWDSEEPLAVSVSGQTITITPPIQLRPWTPYFIMVGAGVRASSGEVLVDDVYVNFTTREASWQPAQTLSVPDGGAYFVAPSISSRGDQFVAVWKHRYMLALKRYEPRTGWSDVALSVPDSPATINDLQVFLDAAGTAYAVYDNNHERLELRRHTISDGWNPIEPLVIDDTDRIGTWQAGMDAAGNIIVAWTSIRFDNRYDVRVSRYVPGSGWGTPVLLDGSFDALRPRVAVHAAGNAMVIWQEFTTDFNSYQLWSRLYTPGSGWALSQRVDGNGVASANEAQIAMDPLGNAAAVYTRAGDVMANYYDRTTGWGTPAALESMGGTSLEPKVAFGEYDDAFHVAWIQSGASATHEIYRNKSQGNQWSNTAQRIATSTGEFRDLQLAIARNDHHETELFVATDYGNSAANVVAIRNIRGRGWVTETLAPRAINSGRGKPQLAINASGSALALWFRDLFNVDASLFE